MRTDAETAANGAGDWFTPRRFAMILGLLILAAFPDVLLGTRTFVTRDFGYFGYPLAHFHREHFWRGEIPLWNPLSYCGMPFLAQWNTLVFYPLSLIYLLFPLSWSLGVFCLFHLFLAGMGMYFLAYRWTRNRMAASFAGVAFAFNGLLLNCLMWPNNIAALGWMPWVVLLVQQAWTDGGKRIVLAALVAATQFLAGGPEIFLLTWLFLAVFAAGALFQRMTPWHAILSRLVGTGTLMTGLVAVQLLPFLELMRHSHRDKTFSAAGWEMPASGWANFIVPLFHSANTPQGVFMQHGQYWTSSYYAGIGVLFLALLAVFRCRNNRYLVLLFASLAVSLILALGDHAYVYTLISRVLPVFKLMRYPVKFVVLAIFVMPLLAALALSVPPPAKWRKEITLMGLFVIAIAIVVWISSNHPVPFETWTDTAKSGLSRGAILCAMLVTLWLLSRLNGRRKVVASAILLILIWADAMTLQPQQVPRVKPWVYEKNWVPQKAQMDPVPKHGESRAMQSPAASRALETQSISNAENNYALSRLALFSNCNLLDDLPKLNGFFSLYPRNIYAAVSLLYVETNRTFTPLMELLGVSQVTSPEKPFDWSARRGWMPMVTIGQQPVFATDEQAFGAFYQTNSNFRDVVFLPKEDQTFGSAMRRTSAKILSTAIEDQRITFETEAAEPSIAVISQTYYPCWKAYVDGQRVKLFRANYALQALEVPAGKHEILLKYEDRMFYLGAAISAAALLICAGPFVARFKYSS